MSDEQQTSPYRRLGRTDEIREIKESITKHEFEVKEDGNGNRTSYVFSSSVGMLQIQQSQAEGPNVYNVKPLNESGDTDYSIILGTDGLLMNGEQEITAAKIRVEELVEELIRSLIPCPKIKKTKNYADPTTRSKIIKKDLEQRQREQLYGISKHGICKIKIANLSHTNITLYINLINAGLKFEIHGENGKIYQVSEGGVGPINTASDRAKILEETFATFTTEKTEEEMKKAEEKATDAGTSEAHKGVNTILNLFE